jgi:uncharacterized protein YbaP (TraB family)
MRRHSTFIPRWLPALFAPIVVACATPPAAPAQAAATAIEKPFLWRIETPVPSYLFGTIHLPDERVTTLPPAVDAVVDAVDALFTEIPMDLGSMMKAAERVQLPQGTQLTDVVGEPLYVRLRAYLEKKGLPVVMFDRAQPWVIGTQLALLDQMKQMATKQPLDMLLATRAKKANRELDALETLDEQLGVFEDLTPQEQALFVTKALDRVERDEAAGVNTAETMIQLYLRGDEAAVAKELNDYEFGDAALQAKLTVRLLDERNLRMADRIVRRLQQAPQRSNLFAVGAAHCAGRSNLLQLLADRGYRLTRLELTDSDAARAREVAAIDAEIERRNAEIAQLRARRERLAPAGSAK